MANRIRTKQLGRYIAITAAIFAGGVISQRALADSVGNWLAAWTMGGHDFAASRSNQFEHDIRPSNAGALTLKWTAATGDVSATPAVQGNAIYFPDWSGNFW